MTMKNKTDIMTSSIKQDYILVHWRKIKIGREYVKKNGGQFKAGEIVKIEDFYFLE